MERSSIILFFIALVIFISSSAIYTFMKTPLQTKTFFTSVEISEDKAGFDVNSTALTFGKVLAGGSGLRRVFLENTYSFPVTVMSTKNGTIASFIDIPEGIIVKPHNSIYIPIILNAHDVEISNNYSGTISLALLRAGR